MQPAGQGSDDDVAAALAASRALLAVVARSLADVLDQLTMPQFRVLVVLCEGGPMRSGDVAERVGVHQSTLTRTADRLVAAGLIRRCSSAENRREVIVDLTDTGRRLVRNVMARRRKELGRILRRASPSDRRAIAAGLSAFARAAGEPDPADLVVLGL